MRTWLKFVGWAIAVVGVVCLLLHLFFFEAWRVPTDDPLLAAAVEPTLSAGDLVVVARHSSVSRGNLVRCSDPDAPGRFVVARAIGRFGDRLEISQEVVSLDGTRNPSPRACDPPRMDIHDPRTDEDLVLTCSIEDYGDVPFEVLRASTTREPSIKTTVEAGQWFLVSDNRHVHLDSRDFGSVDPRTCQHVVFRLVGSGGFGDSRKRLNIIW